MVGKSLTSSHLAPQSAMHPVWPWVLAAKPRTIVMPRFSTDVGPHHLGGSWGSFGGALSLVTTTNNIINIIWQRNTINHSS